jgi:soluble lytic murein transglycosylase-like protein
MQVDSHTQKDQICVFRTGSGTMEFPMSQIAEIKAFPEGTFLDGPKAANTTKDRVKAAMNPDDLLVKAAISQGLEPEFVRSVARIESGLRQDAVSVKGAVGLMQLMPSTATLFGVNAKLAEDNALGGAKFLRELLIRYSGDATLALAAYNAGPGAVAKYRGVPPYLETRQYVIKVIREYQRQLASQKLPVAAIK